MSIEEPVRQAQARGADVRVCNLPLDVDETRFKNALKVLEVQPIKIEFTQAKKNKTHSGFALLTFLEEDGAEYAKKKLHGTMVGGGLWLASFHPSNSKSGAGNLYLKFDEGVDERELFEVLSGYGNMESLKIEETYGYVDFGIPAVAMNLIQDAKAGIVLKKGGPLSAEWYWSKEDRRRPFKEVYFKHAPPEMTEEDVRTMFEQYGTIASFKWQYDEGGKEGWGFANFQRPVHASVAVKCLHGQKLWKDDDERKFYASKTKSPAERAAEKNEEELVPALRLAFKQVGKITDIEFAEHDGDQRSVTITYTLRDNKNRKARGNFKAGKAGSGGSKPRAQRNRRSPRSAKGLKRQTNTDNINSTT